MGDLDFAAIFEQAAKEAELQKIIKTYKDKIDFKAFSAVAKAAFEAIVEKKPAEEVNERCMEVIKDYVVPRGKMTLPEYLTLLESVGSVFLKYVQKKNDKTLVKETATKCSTNENISGQTSERKNLQVDKKPELIIIFGNGFTPSESASENMKRSWLNSNKHLFGENALHAVPTKLTALPWVPYNNFDATISNFRNTYKNRAIDTLNMVFAGAKPINNTAPAMLLCAVWPETDTADIQTLIKNASQTGRKVDYNSVDKKWWQFWK